MDKKATVGTGGRWVAEGAWLRRRVSFRTDSVRPFSSSLSSTSSGGLSTFCRGTIIEFAAGDARTETGVGVDTDELDVGVATGV